MNLDAVNTAHSSSSLANKTSANHDAGRGTAPSSGPLDVSSPAGSRWDTTDTVEISGEARLQLALDTSVTWVQKTAEDVEYSKEDLAPLKKRFAELRSGKKDIQSKLHGLLKKAGHTLGVRDQLKVEIDSQGKARVGGIADARAAKQLAKTINDDPEFLRELARYQKEEKAISEELRAVTGMSLSDYARRISDLQTGKAYTHDVEQEMNDGLNFTREQRLGLQDQDLSLVDSEFAAMLVEEYSTYDFKGDITGTNNILENADETVKSAVSDVISTRVVEYIEGINKGLRLQWGNGEITYEEYQDSVVSLASVTLHVDSDTNTTYEGSFCKNNKKLDASVKETIAKMFTEDLKGNEVTGKKHDFAVASEYLVSQYENAYEEYDSGAKVEVTYRNGLLDARLSSPEKEAELKEEIVVEARNALGEKGIDAEGLEIGVNDKGKLVVANPPADKFEAEALSQALEALNRETESRSVEDHLAAKQPTNDPVKKLKGLLAHLDVFLPGGAEGLGKLDVTKK